MKRIALYLAMAFGTAAMAADPPVQVRVLGDRVNLRAKPSTTAEVVGQQNDGDVLEAITVEPEWVEVKPPKDFDLWVHREFVKDNRVTASKLHVRAGAGINYSVVGEMKKNDALIVRGEFAEWLRVEPPPGTSLWVSRDLVEVMRPKRPEPKPTALPPPRPAVSAPPVEPHVATLPVRPTVPVRPTQEPAAPSEQVFELPKDLQLIPLEGQGRYVQREGELKLVGFVLGAPSRFKLVRTQGGRSDTICYVRGNNRQLKAFLSQMLLIRGREYWVKGSDYPVVIPEQIVPRAPAATP